MEPIAIFWFRRDLRLHDNRGLFHALTGDLPVVPLFIADTNILEDLPSGDARVTFIHEQLKHVNEQLKMHGSSLTVEHGRPEEVWTRLLKTLNIRKVYTNNDYEPYARERERNIAALLAAHDINFKCYKDHVLTERDEVMKKNGQPYTVFTPYSRRWLEVVDDKAFDPAPSEKYCRRFLPVQHRDIPLLEEWGFRKSDVTVKKARISDDQLLKYASWRDVPAEDSTTRLGAHLRFGTFSIREVAAKAKKLSQVLLNQMIWREFYQMILWHYPQVTDRNFDRRYDDLEWRNDEGDFQAWCEGKTGYPIVDAGMRQLNQTGYMHNRVRMVTASFLSKHLLIDWRWGEAYFAEKLLDYELATNNGSWQWAAGTGADAAPYFRIFNPFRQAERFDPEMKYIRQWVPELNTPAYPETIVDHQTARERAIKTFKRASDSKERHLL